jgi:ABC-type sugar transport system permease subunit
MVSPQMIVCLFYTVVDQFLVSNSSVISYINKLALPELQFGYSAAAGWIYTVLIIAVLAVFGLSLNAAVRRYDTV